MTIETIARHKAPFKIMDESNTAYVTMTDPRPNTWEVEEICILADPKALAAAVLSFSIQHHLPPMMVELSVKWPDAPERDVPTDLVFLKKQAD